MKKGRTSHKHERCGADTHALGIGTGIVFARYTFELVKLCNIDFAVDSPSQG